MEQTKDVTTTVSGEVDVLCDIESGFFWNQACNITVTNKVKWENVPVAKFHNKLTMKPNLSGLIRTLAC